MKGYLLFANCRICQRVDQDTRDLIDKALVEGKDPEAIVEEFAEYFPSEYPLTVYALKFHKSHLMEHIARNKIELLAISEDGSIQLSSDALHSTEITKFLSDTAIQTANGVIDEQRILQALIIDSYRDLNKLNEFEASSKESLKLLRTIAITKDQIKQHIAEQIQRSQELKIRVGGEINERLNVQKAMKAMASCCVRVMKSMKFSEEQARIFAEKLKAEMEVDRTLQPYLD